MTTWLVAIKERMSKMFKVVTTDGTVLFENVLTRAAAELTKGANNDV